MENLISTGGHNSQVQKSVESSVPTEATKSSHNDQHHSSKSLNGYSKDSSEADSEESEVGGITAHNGTNGTSLDDKLTYLSQQDLQLFEHQVSGHGTADKGLLKHKNGHILKPLQKPPMGTREVAFYHQIFSTNQETEDCYSKLRDFVPKFYGVACIDNHDITKGTENGTGPADTRRYLLLEDILQGFHKPCVIDVKLGPITWSPDATEAKIKQEKSKYKGTKFPLGICLTGMHYYDIVKNEKCRKSKEFCKNLDASTLKQAFEEYFNGKNSPLFRTLAKNAAHKIRKIEAVFDKQAKFKLFGSSILIAYDADYLTSSCDVGGSGDNIPLRVFMIDFAHFHSEIGDGKVDENYLFGLRNFIKIICDIAEPTVHNESN